MESHAQAVENIKNFIKNPPKDSLGHQIRLMTKEMVQDYLVLVSKIDLLVGASKIEANQVLDSHLKVSTRGQDPRTSKETELKTSSVLAKLGSMRDEDDALNLLLLLGSSQEQEKILTTLSNKGD